MSTSLDGANRGIENPPRGPLVPGRGGRASARMRAVLRTHGRRPANDRRRRCPIRTSGNRTNADRRTSRSMPTMIRTTTRWVSGYGIIVTVLALTLTSCTSVRTRTLERGAVTMTEQQFAAYVEHVFRYHNKVMNDLINASVNASDLGDDGDGLADAEEKMNQACEPLNEVVSAESVAQGVSFWTKRKLPDAVPECEDATQHLEFLLREAFKTRKSLDLTDFPASDPE
jgi:hypothetical protein